MVETTSVRKEKPKLSARDRLCLIQTINALPPTQFDELVFALNPPKGVVASSTAAQGQRSKDLLDWLEGSSAPGLAAADEVLQVLIPKATRTAHQPVAFVMMGRMGDLAPSELEAIVELLRQKTGDDSISLAFSREGSINLILNGSPEGLAKLQEMFEAGELEQINLPPVEAVAPVDTNTQDARKARLIQALRLREQFLRTLEVSASDLNTASNLVHDIDIALALALAIARIRDLDIIGALDSALALARVRDLDLSGADLSGANLHHINMTGINFTGANLTHADTTCTIFEDNLGLTEDDNRDLQSRGAIFTDPPNSDVSNLNQEDVVKRLVWPSAKPIAEIVFPHSLPTSQGNVATLWAMMPEEEINRRLMSTRYNTFVCTMSPHPMMLWLTALYSSTHGTRWLPCYLDLKTPLGEDLATLLSQTGAYKLLLFALENPNRCAHVLSCNISEPQRSLLQEWVLTARTRPSTGNMSTSRDLLRHELQTKLKPKVLQKLKSIGSSEHLVISHAYA